MTRCLVTGGSGFVGVHLVRRLLEEGLSVRVFDQNALEAPGLESEVEVVLGDVRDADALARAARDCERVFHIAAMVPLTRAGSEFVGVNVGGTKNMVAAARSAGAEHMVHLSSSAIYGVPSHFPVREEDEPVPFGEYGQSKLAGERVVERARDEGLPAAIIRPRTIIGPGRMGIFDMLFEWIEAGTPIFLLGRADQPFQLLSNSDLADAMVAASQRRANGTYNLGADEYHSLREDLDEVARRVGSRSRVVGVPAWIARPGLVALDALRLSPLVDWHYQTIDKPYWFDNEAPKRDLGYAPKDSNVKMLLDAYEWYLANRDTVRGDSAHRSRMRRGVFRMLSWLPR